MSSKILYCTRSGVPVLKVETIGNGTWPCVPVIQSLDLVHPVYGKPLPLLLSKLEEQLAVAVQHDVNEQAQQEIALLMSATMYALDAMWQPVAASAQRNETLRIQPSLPSWAVCIGSGQRLLELATWYHFGTSKRLSFPLYRVSKAAGNLRWNNFATWLDDAETIREDWETRKRRAEQDALVKARADALVQVRAKDVYKRLDLNKIWKWLEVQLLVEIAEGRVATFKSLFLTGDTAPEDWVIDDVDDLQVEVLNHCDVGNEIMHFVGQRLTNIRSIIRDYYGSFQLLNNTAAVAEGDSQEEIEKTTELLSSYEEKASALSELPPEPQRASYPTLGKFLQAQAQWRILARRFEARGK